MDFQASGNQQGNQDQGWGWNMRAIPRAFDLTPSRLTDRDLAVVRWIGRQRFAAADQINRRFGMDRSRAYRRLRVCIAAGLLVHEQPFHGPGVYVTTQHGLAAVDLDLPPARVDVRCYRHDLDLAGLCATYELAGHQVVTEREIRTIDTHSDRPRYAVTLGGGRQHFPDLILDIVEGLVAVELERTAKRARRLDHILAGYVRARHLTAVHYHATTPAVRRALDGAIERAHAGHFISVLDVEDDQLAPPMMAATGGNS